jgi:phosphoserine phosphatase
LSFQAYLDTIKVKTGLDPAGLRKLAEEQGWTAGGMLKADTKAGAVVAWLKEQHGLGHGHSMAVFALLKGTKKEGEA